MTFAHESHFHGVIVPIQRQMFYDGPITTAESPLVNSAVMHIDYEAMTQV